RLIRRGQPFDHESVIGSHFLAEIVGTTRVGRKPAVVTTVAGRGWVTDIGQFGCDPEDPFPEGYTLSDTSLRAIWPGRHARRGRPDPIRRSRSRTGRGARRSARPRPVRTRSVAGRAVGRAQGRGRGGAP